MNYVDNFTGSENGDITRDGHEGRKRRYVYRTMQIESLDKARFIEIRDCFIISPENLPLYVEELAGKVFTACYLNYWLLPGCLSSQAFVYSPILSERTYILYWDHVLLESRILVICDLNDQVYFLLGVVVQRDTSGNSILFTATEEDLEECLVGLEWTDTVLVTME